MINRRTFTLSSALAAIGNPAWAQAPYPAGKAVHFIVPVSPGSATDVIVRVVAERLQAQAGFNNIVENKAGAGTTIAAAAVAQSEPDGYTILANSTAQTTAPYLYKKLQFDPVKDFVGVAPVASIPNLLLVRESSPWRNVADLVAAAKKAQSPLLYASAGTGTGTHLNVEKFRLAAGIPGVHVPYKGSPEAIAAVAAGDVDYFFAPGASAIALLKSGRVRALAVGSPRRSQNWPELPTTEEAGVPGSGYEFWTAFFAPAKTPAAVVKTLNTAVNTLLARADVRERFAQLGADPLSMPVEEFQAFLVREQAATAQLVKAADIRLE